MSPREIDALVAHHVYGWHRYDDTNGEFLPHQGWDAPEAKCGVLPEFSTDPADSKQLRDKMRADGWSPAMWWEGKSVVASFREVTPDGHLTGTCKMAESDTEEMAVALAALAAVGKRVAP